MKCQNMVKDVTQVKGGVFKCLVLSDKPKDVQFTMKSKKEKKHPILKLEKVKPENVQHFCSTPVITGSSKMLIHSFIFSVLRHVMRH